MLKVKKKNNSNEVDMLDLKSIKTQISRYMKVLAL